MIFAMALDPAHQQFVTGECCGLAYTACIACAASSAASCSGLSALATSLPPALLRPAYDTHLSYHPCPPPKHAYPTLPTFLLQAAGTPSCRCGRRTGGTSRSWSLGISEYPAYVQLAGQQEVVSC